MPWITPVIAFIFLVVAVFGIFTKSGKNLLRAIPFGNPMLWSVVFLIVGLLFGGIAYGGDLFNNLGTATISGPSTQPGVTAQAEIGACTLSTLSTAGAGGTGISTRTDPSNLQHYYIDVPTSNSSASLNGTLSCPLLDDSVSTARSTKCYITSSSFRSQVSTTDSNTYYIIATTASSSKVNGYPWAQTAYLNDGSVATTSSNQEATTVAFAEGTAIRLVGYYFTLPGTAFATLNNQTQNDISLYCGAGLGADGKYRGGSKEFTWTVTKLTG